MARPTGYLIVYLARCGAHAFLYGKRGYVLPLLHACKKRVVLVARVNTATRMFSYGSPMAVVQHKVLFNNLGGTTAKAKAYMQWYLNQHAK